MTERKKRTVANMQDLLEKARARHLHGGEFLLDDDDAMPSLWGDGHSVLWPFGEGLMIAGGVGVGKSTILQQLILHGIGVRDEPFLGYSVELTGIVGYVAADRPSQIRRSMRRMVTEADRALLDARLSVWRGPFPFDLVTAKVGGLADFVEERGWDVLAIDSLKDVVSTTTEDDGALAINRQFQELLARGKQLVVNHHDRKSDGKRGTARTLDDVYGSRWLTAGVGSVLYVSGDPGAEDVELHHFKVPADRVGPLALRHDHAAGTTRVAGTVVVRKTRSKGAGEQDVLDVLPTLGKATAEEVGTALGVSREMASRYLRSLVGQGKVVAERAGTTAPTTYRVQ